MKIGFLLIVAAALAFFYGCETFSDSYRRDDNYLSRRTVTESPATVTEQQLAQLSANIAALNVSNTEIIKHINEIYQKLNALQQADASLQSSVNSLRQELEQTKTNWQKVNEKMIEQITSEINDSISKAGKQQISSTTKPGNTGTPIGGGEFYVHTVEPGSTLNAIAKAYGVTVSEIKTANGMANDLIRVGQKLYIPKK